MSRLFKLFCFWGIAVCTCAEPFGGPLIGYFFDTGTRQIMALTGIPGAALARPAVPGLQSNQALVASDGSFAIVAMPDSGTLGHTHPMDLSPAISAIEGSMRSFEKGALSPNGASAIVYGSSCECAQILSGIRTGPKVARTVPVPASAKVSALAVTDDGSVFAISTGPDTDATTVSIYFNNQDLPAMELPIAASSLVFTEDGNNLAIAETARKAVSLLSNVTGSAELIELAAERDGIKNPVAVQFAFSKLLVADPEAGAHLIDLVTREFRTIECACKPEMLERTGVRSIFRITQSASGAVWILQLSDALPRTMFVPLAEELK
jgi:hypothetical protein